MDRGKERRRDVVGETERERERERERRRERERAHAFPCKRDVVPCGRDRELLTKRDD